MPAILVPGQVSETSIELQTRLGNDIENFQSHEFSSFEQNYFEYLKGKYPRATPRTRPNPIYNCLGLTFASSRTQITSETMLKLIIDDDGYTEISKDDVMPGDIIVYYKDNGTFQHAGIVLSWDGELNVPLVWSKWGRYAEMTHWGHDSPYNFANTKYFRITR